MIPASSAFRPWSAHANRATDSPFTIIDGTDVLATIDVNQQVVPNEEVDQGVAWEDLGDTHAVRSSTLIVRLSDDFVIADSIRIERLADLPAAAIDGVFASSSSVANILD